MLMPIRPAIFFDRDGVVNLSPGPGYVLSIEAFSLDPAIGDLLALAKSRGYLAIVVTSQKGVGKGLMTLHDLDAIHASMQAALRERTGFEFDAIYSHTGLADCPFPPKPDPGMIRAAAERFGIDLHSSWLIGDADRDIEMGIAAGLKGNVRVRSEKAETATASHTVDTVAEAVDFFRTVL